MNYIYILQKRTSGIQNAHYVNVMSFSNVNKAIRHCLKELNLEPKNMVTVESFKNSEVMEFADIKRYGIKNEKSLESNFHRIQRLDIK